MAEQRTHKPWVAGSSPALATNYNIILINFLLFCAGNPGAVCIYGKVYRQASFYKTQQAFCTPKACYIRHGTGLRFFL